MKNLRFGDWKLKGRNVVVGPAHHPNDLRGMDIVAHVSTKTAKRASKRIGDGASLLTTLEGFVGAAILVSIRPCPEERYDPEDCAGWLLEWKSSGEPLAWPPPWQGGRTA